MRTMNVSIPAILLSLEGKCLLNWSLLFLQRHHVYKSFLGVFSVSLAVVDTILTLFVATLHIQADGYVFLLDLKLTRYHICLLVQILGQVYNALQWPVVVLAGLDHFSSVTLSLQPVTIRVRCFVSFFVTSILWCLTVLYVFSLSGFVPVLEHVSYNQIQQCYVHHTSQVLQVSMFLLLTLGCAKLHAECSTQSPKVINQSRADCRRTVVHQTVCIFLNKWAVFLFFQAVLFFLPAGIPAYLGQSVAWLCFVNSLLIAVVLGAVCPAEQLALGLAAVPPDSFCEWRFKFSSAVEDTT